jgi:hypothetical protein
VPLQDRQIVCSKIFRTRRNWELFINICRVPREEEKLLAFYQTIEEETIRIFATAAKLIFTDLKNL